MIIKTVFIVRHSFADYEAKIDFERPLTAKGINVAKETAQDIKKICSRLGITIDHCIASAANRTKQTADIISEHLGVQSMDFHQKLYNASTGDWLDLIQSSKAKTLLLVGHNPTMSSLVSLCSSQNIMMKPANYGCVQLEVDSDGVRLPAKLLSYYQHEH